MGFLSRLFGIGQEEITVTRLGKARNCINEDANSGLVRHYDARGVADYVELRTGETITEEEAMGLVEECRQKKGWSRRPRESYFHSED